MGFQSGCAGKGCFVRCLVLRLHEKRHEEGDDQQRAEEGQGARGTAAARPLHHADQVRPDESAQVADGVDDRHRDCSRRTRQEQRRQGPERGLEAVETGQRDANQTHRGHGVEHHAGGEQGHGGHPQRNRRVQLALAAAIGTARPENHRDGGEDVGAHGDQADLGVSQWTRQALDDLRHPVAHAEAAALIDEVDEGQVEDLAVLHRLQDAEMLDVLALQAVALQLAGEPGFLIFAQPLRLLRLVGQAEETDPAEDHRRQSFQEEHPAPAAPVQPVHVIHDPGAHRRAGDVGHRDRGGEQRHRRGEFLAAEPVGQIDDDAREETGFGHPQEETQDVQLGRALDEGRQRRQDAPGDQDAGDPHPRAVLVEHHVARHFEEEVADEEDARGEAEGFAAERQVRIHLQRRIADVGAIQVGDDVEQEDEGHDPPGDLADDGLFAGFVDAWHGCLRVVFLISDEIQPSSGWGSPSPSRGGLGWGWGSAGVKPIPIPTFPLKGGYGYSSSGYHRYPYPYGYNGRFWFPNGPTWPYGSLAPYLWNDFGPLPPLAYSI